MGRLSGVGGGRRKGAWSGGGSQVQVEAEVEVKVESGSGSGRDGKGEVTEVPTERPVSSLGGC